MSYDCELRDPLKKRVIELAEPHKLRGAIYAKGGSKRAWLSVTYNYAGIIGKVFHEDGIRHLQGMSAKESIPLLEAAIAKLADDPDEDYFKPTEGNVKQALRSLLTLAKQAPHGVWDII